MLTQNKAEIKKSVSRYLEWYCQGASRAHKGSQIAAALNIEWREVAQAIHDLRMDGHIIGSSKSKPYGYYLPVTQSEKDNFFNTYRSEVLDMLKVLNRMKRSRRQEIEGMIQQELF